MLNGQRGLIAAPALSGVTGKKEWGYTVCLRDEQFGPGKQGRQPEMAPAAWNKEQAGEIIAAHAHGEGPLLPMLHALNAAFGHVPDEAVPMIAAALNLTRAEVHGVVSFYHDYKRKPAGRRVLKFCRAEACQAAGGDAVAERAAKKLGIAFGETTRRWRDVAGGGVLPRALPCRSVGHARRTRASRVSTTRGIDP